MRSTMFAAAPALLVALAACGPGGQEAPRVEDVASAATTLALPFVENDFSAALSRAKEAKLPLFVEVWAPW
jgi:hypothetical protein